ncbi:bola-like protein [Guillardia theta CCMP2712]|uniref:Bola-like protein n=1 Tax=Guillardia theta (strain CCMP2712) TaxID=905079 RepID=L1JG61_GUITC|nr:bola-like protein [Guillardia theta CCMP2712]EKX47134.1 bola-like protein [Guillardia theta CCMP2712]|mmetsp:Transcript_47189/g.147636  ORF Transcript_47189/g.147636 Transcript_47189/m.147636 type:complete len:85 (-) Transcript_47189:53-307(-)|eukprot:XP_005834114.1 bola-like protein [Guillardia theta CCMP2712]
MAAQAIEQKLRDKLKATVVEVVDLSDGCGAKLDLLVVSEKFVGMSLLDRQRSVHEAIEEEMKTIHALTMKTKTPEQYEAMKAKG